MYTYEIVDDMNDLPHGSYTHFRNLLDTFVPMKCKTRERI